MRRSAQQIGARSFVTPKVELWGSVGNGSYQGANTSAGAAGPKLDFTGYQVGTNYWMSKRTNVYALLGGASSASNIQGTPSVSSGAGNAATYAAGLRHTF